MLQMKGVFVEADLVGNLSAHLTLSRQFQAPPDFRLSQFVTKRQLYSNSFDQKIRYEFASTKEYSSYFLRVHTKAWHHLSAIKAVVLPSPKQ
jgi:hypothetical protein